MFTVQSPLSTEKCLAALKSGTVEETLFGPINVPVHTILCKVNGNRFRLREKRNYRNSFGSFFYGEIKPNLGGGAEISGRFRMHPFVIAFMAVWFGMLILIATMMMFPGVTVHRPASQNAPIMMFGAPILMTAFAGGMIWIGWWLSRNERVRIIQFLGHAFSSEQAAARYVVPPLRTTSMTGAILFFGGLGLMSVLGGVSGVSSFQFTDASPGASHHQISYFANGLGQAFAVVDGGFMILLAYGIWKKLRIAWKMGFALFGLILVTSPFTFLQTMEASGKAQDQPPLAVQMLMIVPLLAVGAYWSYWWYKKRDYFVN